MKTLKLFAYLFSGFSVLFSFSTVIELHRFTSTFVFILTSIFLLSFTVYVEIAKVRELIKYFAKRESSKLIIGLMFSLSFILSGVGIFFWTNTSYERNKEIAESKQTSTLLIEKKYSKLTDSINSIKPNFSDIEKEIVYWKSRTASSLEERSLIRENTMKLTEKKIELSNYTEKQKEGQIKALNQQKQAELNLIESRSENKGKENGRNDFLTVIFLIMVIVTEFLIVGIQKQISTHFDGFQLSALKAIKENEYRGTNFHGEMSINKLKYNKHLTKHMDEMSSDDFFKQIKDLYNLIYEIDLIDDKGKLRKGATNQLRNYYSHINSI